MMMWERGVDETIIYHNPNCGTSRKVLAMLQDAGTEHRVVRYLETPPDRAELLALLDRLGMAPRQILRRRGTPYDALGLDDETVSDEDIIAAILAHPILMERPIVTGPKGTRLCRPADIVRDLLS